MTMRAKIHELIKNLEPKLNKGDYVFTSTNDLSKIDLIEVICTFKEVEGVTIVLEKSKADLLGLSYQLVFSWITLNVQSSLSDVGLTAMISKELTHHNISCNVIAGFYHDHLFIQKEEGLKALDILVNLSSRSN